MKMQKGNMKQERPLKIVLLTLTGFGNKVIPALLKKRVKILKVFARKEPGPFPYYREEQIHLLCARNNIPIENVSNWNAIEVFVKKHKPNLLLVATFHKIIPKRIIDLFPLAINLHPSLLPNYKGRKPFDAVLAAGEKETGLTAHSITEKVDSGPILLQKKIAIEPADTIGSLRKKLAALAGEMAEELIDKIRE